jgi:hypothetical protein
VSRRVPGRQHRGADQDVEQSAHVSVTRVSLARG